MSHQISLPTDNYFMISYLASVIILIGVLLFAVQVKEISRNHNN